jgi:coproporphyrinogen III oxidase-like Fe-S oxidoreductase
MADTATAAAVVVPEPPALDAGTGVYLHIPFCLRRCHYCDFNTYADRGGSSGVSHRHRP